MQGGEAIGSVLAKVEALYNPIKPEASVPDLLTALTLMEGLPDGHWKHKKMAETKQVIQACLGLYLEASTLEAVASPSDSIAVHFEAINRSLTSVRLLGLSFTGGYQNAVLQDCNRTSFSNQYSSRGSRKCRKYRSVLVIGTLTTGMYTVSDPNLIGRPESPRYFNRAMACRSQWQADHFRSTRLL